MATLTGTYMPQQYRDLLQVSNSNAGVDATLRDVEDGEATASAVQLSTAGMKVDGNFEVTGVYTGTFDVVQFNEQSADPSNPAEGDGQIWLSDGTGTGADGDLIYERQAGGATWYCNMTDQSRRGVMWHDESIVTSGAALTRYVRTSHLFAASANQSSAASGDTFTNGCYLRKGTYTFYALGLTANNLGQADWTIDGVTIVDNQEWYSATLTWNVIKSVASVSVTYDGWHKIQCVCNSKHASSSDYHIGLTCFWFEPAAD